MRRSELIRGAGEQIFGGKYEGILTAAAGALKGLFEAQKRLAGNKPSLANSLVFKRQPGFPRSRV